MAEDPRVYSDEEFALILRKAAEIASRAETRAGPSGGLTLAEMKSAAAQAGLDPALVERAARMLTATRSASPVEWLTGGPLRHHHEVRLPVILDEQSAARLLSAVRIAGGLAGHRDVGHSSSMGMTWHDGGDLESLSVMARPDDDGTSVSVVLSRGGPFALVAMSFATASFLTVLFSVFALYPEAPALGVTGFIAGVGGALAAARGYWAASTRRVRERIGDVMDTIEQTLRPSEVQRSAPREIGEGAAAAGGDDRVDGDAELTGEPPRERSTYARTRTPLP